MKGAYVASLTPFKENREVDLVALEKHVAWLVSEGTDGIVCCGATGEGAILTEDEKKRIVEVCVQTVPKTVPVIVGTGTPNTNETIRINQEMLKLGAAGCLVVTPLYCKPSQKGCVEYFREIAKAGLPIIVYHNPGRAVVRLKAETIAEIGEIPGIAALKDSGGVLELIRQVRKISKIPILSGDDDLTFETIREGGVGAISVIGNIFPRQWKQMIQLALDQKFDRAEWLARRYLPICKAMFLETNPQCIKWTASWFGRMAGYLRLPLLTPEVITQQSIKQVVVGLGLPQFSIGTNKTRTFR